MRKSNRCSRCKRPHHKPCPPPCPEPSHVAMTLVCGRLTNDDAGNLAVSAAEGVAKLETGIISDDPLVRSWIVTSEPVPARFFDEGSPEASVVFGAARFVCPPGLPFAGTQFFAPRTRAPLTVTPVPGCPNLVMIRQELFLVDQNEQPIDPITSNQGTIVVPFEFRSCGNKVVISSGTIPSPPCG